MLTIPISPRGTIPPLLSVVVDILAVVVAVVALLLHIHSPTKEKSGDLVLTLVWLAMMNTHGVPVTLGSISGPEVKGETRRVGSPVSHSTGIYSDFLPNISY